MTQLKCMREVNNTIEFWMNIVKVKLTNEFYNLAILNNVLQCTDL